MGESERREVLSSSKTRVARKDVLQRPAGVLALVPGCDALSSGNPWSDYFGSSTPADAAAGSKAAKRPPATSVAQRELTEVAERSVPATRGVKSVSKAFMPPS